MKLIHLGCLDQPHKDWENFDITPHIFISKVPFLASLLHSVNLIDSERYSDHKNGVFKNVKYLNLAKKLPWKSNSVDAFFSSHVFEHLYYSDLKNLLKEIYRCLKPKGYIRTILPDLDYLISNYDQHNPNFFLSGLFENTGSKSSRNTHKWMYNKYSFKNELIEAGFEENKIIFSEYKRTAFAPFLDLDNRKENSFFIEAQK